MADTRFRELERAAEAGGSADEARLLNQRVRLGQLSSRGLRIAAYLGHPGASFALTGHEDGLCPCGLDAFLDCEKPSDKCSFVGRAPSWIRGLYKFGFDAVFRGAVAVCYVTHEFAHDGRCFDAVCSTVSALHFADWRALAHSKTSRLRHEAARSCLQAAQRFTNPDDLQWAHELLLAGSRFQVDAGEEFHLQAVVESALEDTNTPEAELTRAIKDEVIPWALGLRDVPRERHERHVVKPITTA